MKMTNKFNLPNRIIRQVGEIHKPKEKRISVTDLISCPRERTLLIKEWDKVILDYSDFLSTIIGLSVHERQNKLASEDDESEVKYIDKFNGIEVVGRADNYDTVEKCIRETKTKAVGCLKFESFLKDVERQLNVYAYQRRVRGYEVEKLELDVYYRDWKDWEADRANLVRYAVMKEGRRTALKVFDTEQEAKDWMALHCKPNEQLRLEIREPAKDYPQLSVDFSIPIPLWSLDEEKQFILDQIELFALDSLYCDEECTWNGKKCDKYCKARTVCDRSKCFLGDK
jgi:hypothetical protein